MNRIGQTSIRRTRLTGYAAVAAFGLAPFTVAATLQAAVRAFPTADGFGANAVGARGGRGIDVENYLNELAGDPVP